MEIEKKEELNKLKYDKYSIWLGIIENVEEEQEISDSNPNLYDLNLLRKVEIINENVYLPIYVKSPSELYGFNESEEKKIKFYLLLMMQEAGIILRVPQNSILTSQLIFNRFFWRVGLNSYEPFVIAMTSFYIGCKSEETYKRIRDVISVFYKLYSTKKKSEADQTTKSKSKGAADDKNVSKSNIRNTKENEKEEVKQKNEHILDICSEEYKVIKNNICFYEIQILKELGFSIYSLCDHPHKYLTHFIKHLKGTKELLQKSWNYLNDAYKTDIPIHYPPHVIACSAIFLAARCFKLPLPQAPWWEIYDTKIEEIQNICSSLLSLNHLYSSNSVFNIKLSEISQILFSKSNLKALYEQQEKAKLDLIEKEKRQREKEKNKDAKERKNIKYEYGKRKRSHSRSRSRSKGRDYKRSKVKESHHRKHRKSDEISPYSDSSSQERGSYGDEKSYSESSSSVDAEKIKQRINIMEKDHKKKMRRSSTRKRRGRSYSYSSSDSDSYYKKNRKSKYSYKTKRRKRSAKSSSRSSSRDGGESDSSSMSSRS